MGADCEEENFALSYPHNLTSMTVIIMIETFSGRAVVGADCEGENQRPDLTANPSRGQYHHHHWHQYDLIIIVTIITYCIQMAYY